MKILAEVIGDPNLFLEDLFGKINDIELDVDQYELDHLCYRVESSEQYALKKTELAPLGALLVESMVNGRLIATYKLHEPIVFKNRNIYLLELPSPKPGHSYKSGLEHVEFVTKEPLQKIVDRYPQYSFEVFGIHKNINADITLKLGEYCIRFHNKSLEDVIKMELKMFNHKSKS
jgi:predicted metalloenzyme YecM